MKTTIVAIALGLVCASSSCLRAQSATADTGRDKVIFDTDIGDDIDDAFALGLALSDSKLDVLAVTTAWGDTDLRARLAARFLAETGHREIPVAAGPRTKSNSQFTQARWAESWPEPDHGWPDAINLTLNLIRHNPGQITLISVAPFSNVGALIDRDPETFRKLKRIVIMGGSIHRGYGDLGFLPDHGPDPEYNILLDIPSARTLFASGVPLFVMPLDSTQLKLQEVLRGIFFSHGSPTTNALALLYAQWTASTLNPTPTLFDAMAVAAAIDPELCPTQPMHIEIDGKGYTREAAGEPNAQVCLNSSSEKFFDFYMRHLLGRNEQEANRSGAESNARDTCGDVPPQRNSTFIDADGIAHVTRVVPVPQTVSVEAQRIIGSNFANCRPKNGASARPISPEQAMEEGRKLAINTEERLGREASAMYPVEISSEVIAGVPVRVITPRESARSHAQRILINLHGGGFVADWGSLTETIPIASLAHTKVISVLYRMAPEHPFPAALDDVAAVYREILKSHKPGEIGLYGTSAGAILTAEAAARFRHLGLPLPGALGIFSGTGDLSRRGDTYSIFSVNGLTGALEAKSKPPFPEYVRDENPRDPLLSPLYADLHGFPPTLFLSSTRDMLLSDTAILHRAFLRASVPAQLVVFEALQHGFWNDPKLPESREADRIIANFFDTHLGG